jgi:hypothetical protein
MAQQLVILAADAARQDLHARIVAKGGRVAQAYGTRVWIVDPPDGAGGLDDLEAYPGQVPEDVAAAVDDETGRLGIAAWNERHSASFAATRVNRIGDGRSWGDEGVEPEG